jgi:hypothetical protein
MTESNCYNGYATGQDVWSNPEAGGPEQCFGLCVGTGKRGRSVWESQVMEPLVKPL